MKTKKIKHLIFLSAFVAIFLAVISIFAVNKIMARENSNSSSRGNSSSSSVSGQEISSKAKSQEEVKRELKPEVSIEVVEIEEDKDDEQESKSNSMEKSNQQTVNKNETSEEDSNSSSPTETTDSNQSSESSSSQSSSENQEQTETSSRSQNNNGSSKNVSQIKSEVTGAEKVEYKLVKSGSVDPSIHLGEGKKSDSNGKQWSLDYDFSNVPVGEYDLYAEVRNQYGTYTSKRIPITIEEDNFQTMGKRIQLGQEGITIKVSNIRNNNTGQKLKEITKQQEEIKNDPNLTEEEKELKLNQLEESKKQLIKEFNFRNQIEEIYKKQGDKNLTDEDKNALEEIKEILKVDSDGDGLPDHEELRIGTDPFSADTDQDGYLDGDEVANGYDPLTPSTKEGIDKIVFDEPKNSGKENILYQVNKVSLVENENSEKKGIVFEGRALPNSFITLYVYSSPVVVTVKTDEDGNWSYVLNKELEDGNHEVYAAVTDNTGKITSKSKPLAFVKTAQAISSVDSVQDKSSVKLSPVETEKSKLMIFVIFISIFSLISALTSIILLIKHNREKLGN